MTIGERIVVARKNIGISQTTLADKINVSKQTLYKYENNIITNIPSDKIEHIAKVCNISPSYLMGWEDTPTESTLTTRDIKQIEDVIEETKKTLLSQKGLMFEGGAPASEEAIESIVNAMELGMEMAKKKNKEKYTPNKYKKD